MEKTDQHFLSLRQCPVCNSDNIRTLFSAKDLLMLKDGIFKVEECQICNYKFTNPQPSRDTIFNYYTSDYPGYKPGIKDIRNNTEENNSPDPIESEFPDIGSTNHNRSLHFYGGFWGCRAWVLPDLPHDSKVLELGCGAGSFIRQCTARGWEAIGTDLNPELEHAVTAVGGKFTQTTLPKINFPDNYFDAIFAWQVVEHLYDPLAVCKEVRRVLRKGGFFIFSVPNSNCWQFWFFREKWAGLQVPTHLSHFSIKNLKFMLEVSSFEIDEIYGQNTAGCVIPSILLLLGKENVSLGSKILGSPLLTKAIDRILGLGISFIFGKSQAERLTIVCRKL